MQLTIEKLIYGGDGLARTPADEHGKGKTVFVPLVVPGEMVEATLVESRPGFARARLDGIIKSSAERVQPGCPYFGACGGCHYQHIDYPAQLRYKSEILRETLRRTAKLELQQEIHLHPSPPWNYRSRTRMQVRHTPEFALGYFRLDSHELLPVESCPISSPLINQAIAAVWKLGRSGIIGEVLHGLQFFVNQNDTELLLEGYIRVGAGVPGVAVGAKTSSDIASAAALFQPLAAALRVELPQLQGVVIFPASAVEDESRQRAPLTAVSSAEFKAIGSPSLQYHAVGYDYRVGAGSFFQTNRFLLDELALTATAGRTGRSALDLYAGAGLFTQLLARNFDQVLAVEASPHSFADLRYNVPENVKCLRTTTEAFLAERASKLAPDLVLVDPPRAGLGEKTAAALGRMSVSHVTYVSCDPATLARDLRVLLESGFRVEQAHLVDMFPQTYHMETVLHLAR